MITSVILLFNSEMTRLISLKYSKSYFTAVQNTGQMIFTKMIVLILHNKTNAVSEMVGDP